MEDAIKKLKAFQHLKLFFGTLCCHLFNLLAVLSKHQTCLKLLIFCIYLLATVIHFHGPFSSLKTDQEN